MASASADLAPHRMPLWKLSAVEMAAGIQAGTFTVEALAREHLDRITLREPLLKAWAWHDADAVLRQLDSRLPAAPGLPLLGIPVGVKDIIDTADMPTAYGSPIYRGHQPVRDALVVDRLRKAGALIMGKTATAEFAFSSPPATVNPHHLEHTPGGSSSGSAAAVADGMVPLALASQTGGSTIRPASFCGVVGFKPTYDVVSLAGVKPLAPSEDTLGLHARSVADVALLFSVLTASKLPALDSSPGTGARVACYPGPYAGAADAEAREALERVCEVLRNSGAVVEFLDLPASVFGELGQASRAIMAYEAAISLTNEYERHRPMLTPALIDLIETGLGTSDAQYRNSLELVERAKGVLANAMRPFQCLITFSAPGAAPPLSAGTGNSIFNRDWTALGAPCLSLPMGAGRTSRLPIGVQLVAAPGDDFRLLSVAKRVEFILQPFNRPAP